MPAGDTFLPKDMGDEAEATVLGGSGTKAGVAVLAAQLLLVVVLVALDRASVGAVLVLLLPAVALAWTLLFKSRDVVRLEPDALVVDPARGEPRRYAWEDILEVSWRPAPRLGSMCGPVLRIRGGAYDAPGPNFPAPVAALSIFGAGAQREAVEALRKAARKHDVPHDDDMQVDISRGKRSPRLPDERR